jgi:putative Mg2+ transporter-C (MgtC) family protein
VDGFTEILLLFKSNLDKFPHVLVRMIAALVCGVMIGWERESKGKPAGLRTNTLICLGSCMYMMIGTFVSVAGIAGSDPSRIGAQVVSGVGFLGAGTIIRGRASVTGLTSAATIWVAAAVGLSCGAGYAIEAVMCTVALLLVLTALGRIEAAVVGPCQHKTVEVTVDGKNARTQSLVGGLFEQNLRGKHPLMWVSDGDRRVLRAPVCVRHMGHRAFLSDVWRLRGVRDVSFSDGTVPFVPPEADDMSGADATLAAFGGARGGAGGAGGAGGGGGAAGGGEPKGGPLGI